ncbi:2-dehydro-3-deoxy-phosphogluconate aldolase [Spirochaetia bacterium]|nr:2-dehydro-3-deoxy-phosphogluconate aldolase [Spirochaetia bacterium]
MTVKEQIAANYLIPVVVIDDAARVGDAAEAVRAGGLDIIEITLRTPAAMEAIANVARSCPSMLVGGGTVLSLDKCKEAVSLGASFITSPGFDPVIVDYCIKNNITIFPGCVTPTEIMAAIEAGLEVVKFFPATLYGGLKAIKTLSGPFPNIRFLPSGGIDQTNLAEYITPKVFAIGGNWLCTRESILTGDYAAITRTCEQSLVLVKQLR